MNDNLKDIKEEQIGELENEIDEKQQIKNNIGQEHDSD